MRQLVREQPAPLGCVWRELAGRESDVGANGERARVESTRRHTRRIIGKDANRAEIVAEPRFHLTADLWSEHLAFATIKVRETLRLSLTCDGRETGGCSLPRGKWWRGVKVRRVRLGPLFRRMHQRRRLL